MITTLEFHKQVEEFVQENEVDYIEAIIHLSEKYNIDLETMGAFIAKDLNLVSKIQVEAENLHFIKKISTLPI